MSYEINDKYIIKDLTQIIYHIETEVLLTVQKGKLLGKRDDADLLVPSLTRSISLIRQIVILCENGFPDGELMLARNIYEQMIICSFIENQEDETKHDEFLRKYFQDAELIRLKYQNESAKRFNIEKEIQETNELIEKHNKIYGSNVRKQYWWANKSSFKSLSDEITKREDAHYGLINNMHMEYKLACIALHPSSFGNIMNVGSDIRGIDMRTRNTGHENALFLAVSSLIALVGYTYDYIGLDSSHVLSELNRLGIYYLKMLQRSGVQNN